MTPNNMPTTTQNRKMELMDHQITEVTRRLDTIEKRLDLLRDHVNANENNTDIRFEAIAAWLESEDE